MKNPLPICGLDSEDDGKGTPTLFGVVTPRGRTWARERHTMLEKLSSIASDLGGVQVWCTNLEYDLLNLFGEERIAELTLRFGKSFLCGASWRKRKVEFRDTIRHVPVSVEKLGELIGKEKLEKDLFDSGRAPTFEQLLRRCLRDASITRSGAVKLVELYEEANGRARMTLASSAYNIWASNFWKREIHRPPHEIWDAAFQAYYGGRTEPFAVGTFERVRAVDAASMFPWAMTAAPFPIPWGSFQRVLPGTEPVPNGLYRARVDSELDLPLLPYRSSAGLIFPNGRWTGWYVGSELRAFRAAGGKVRILGGFTFTHEARPFDGYIRTMFERKSRSKGARRMFYKLMLNALYGKFGQRGERVIAVPLDQARKMKLPVSYRIWAGLAMYSEKRDPPPWGNNVWPAIVTARARVRLWEEMVRIKWAGGRLLYCDTDGILFQGGSVRYPAKAREPGDFESRGAYRCAMIRAKKEYALQDQEKRWSFYAKGVPAAARERYLKTGEVEFDRPVKLREAARSGEKTNVWRSVRKVRRINFDDRVRLRDGGLAPINVSRD